MLLALCLLLVSVLPAHAQTPAATPLASRYTVGQCQGLDRDALRAEIETAALAVVGSGTAALDIDALVERKWRDLNVDVAIDAEVSRAVDALAAQEGYWSRLLSGWSAGKAQEFARAIAQDAFTSSVFTQTIASLSGAIGEEIARQVNAQLAEAASSAFLCLRDYVGAAYSETLFNAFEESVRATTALTGTIAVDPTISVGIIDTHGGLITGAGIIVITEVGRRVALKISEDLAERVAGKVITRVLGRAGSSFLPVAGWVVGVGLILWDLYQGGNGALPQIKEALTSEEVKARIRSEVADAVRAGLPEEAQITALETAVSMIEEFDTFCTRYASICTLAQENASFRSLLNTLPLSELEHLQTLENTFLQDVGRAALDQALETGAFDQLLALPPEAATVLADTKSVTTTLAWADLAGPDFALVANIGIPRFAPPQEITRDRLDMLLGWNDGVAVRKLLLLDPAARQIFWALPGNTLLDAMTNLDDPDLTELAVGLAQWPADGREAVVRSVLAEGMTVQQVQAGPTPLPTFAAPPTGAPGTGAPGTGAASAITASAIATDAIGATGAPPTRAPATPHPAATASGGTAGVDPTTLGLLGVVVLLLALIVVLLFWRRRPG